MRAVEFLDKNEVQLAPCYLLQGTDGYIVRSVVDKILSALPEEDREFNYAEFGEEAPVADVIAALETVSLTGGRRVVFMRRRNRAFSPEEKRALGSYLSAPNLDSVFVVEDSPGRYTEYDDAFFRIECKEPSPDEMKRSALARIGEGGCSVRPTALAKLVSYCNGDYGRMIAEARKLCDYADGGEIDEDAVDALVAPDSDYRGYLLASAFDEGNGEKALGMLAAMQSKGEPAARTLYAITSSYRKMLHCAISDLSDAELAKATGASLASVRTTRNIIAARKRSVPGYVVKLKEQTEYLYGLEYKFKSGRITDENALRLAVGKLLAVNAR